MSTVQEIEKAIEHLPQDEFFGLVDRLRERHAALWDGQIEADAKAGRLDFMWEEAQREIVKEKRDLSMKSSTTLRFREALKALTPEIQALAIKNYRLWKSDPRHPSLHFKKAGNYWSIRVGDGHRALARENDGTMYWIWIGPHKEYERKIVGR